MQKQICYLFDIDGTLLSVGHRGRQAFCSAIATACCVDNNDFNPNMAGRTDLSIIHEAMEHYHCQLSPELLDNIYSIYLNILDSLLQEPGAITVFPGAQELLDSLAQAGGILALGTGNIQAGAKIKMCRANLWSYIQTGGYGDDHQDRNIVLATGLERAQQLIHPNSFSEYWVIGDTPLDIAAGKAIGAKTCAIANGRYSPKELSQYQPDLCFPNLLSAKESLLDSLMANSN